MNGLSTEDGRAARQPKGNGGKPARTPITTRELGKRLVAGTLVYLGIAILIFVIAYATGLIRLP